MSAPCAATVWVGIDIGGTFTDLFVVDVSRETALTHKVLTDHKDPTASIERGLRDLVQAGRLQADEVTRVVHGTTLVTNAVIQRRGAKTALLTTEGFRDTLEIGTEHRYDLYDLAIDKPVPVVPRRLRRPVAERVLADGTIERPLDEEQVRAEIEALINDGVEAVAVCLLHSYRNDRHERRVAEIVGGFANRPHVSLSSDVAPEIREYERSSTTAINAFVAPVVEPYLSALAERLSNLGIRAPLLIMQSNGGTATPDAARRYPVRLLESGPAAGAIGAGHIARSACEPRVFFFDMGGTTAKGVVVDDGAPLIARRLEVAHVYRFKRGSGLPVQAPTVDMIEIGAGGGSIAHIDQLGLLKVGPDSAESDPGPACYALGGTQPTVTDADLVLGYIGADSFLSGRMRLDVEAARRAISDHVATPLDLSIEEAAWGIHRVVNENMASAARIHLLEHGRTPSAYTMVAFGGAGPVHAYGVARILGLASILVPVHASVGSAYGLLCAPVAFETARSFPVQLGEVDWAEARDAVAALREEGIRLVTWAGVDPRDVTVEIAADMRYRGQGHEITVPLTEDCLDASAAHKIEQAFRQDYQRLNAVRGPDAPIELVTWRVAARGPEPDVAASPSQMSVAVPAPRGRRPVWLDGGGFVDAAVVPVSDLSAGETLAGPAIIEMGDASLTIGPDARATMRHEGLIVVDIERSERS
jgi:N-methylhydantoinase A